MRYPEPSAAAPPMIAAGIAPIVVAIAPAAVIARDPVDIFITALVVERIVLL